MWLLIFLEGRVAAPEATVASGTLQGIWTAGGTVASFRDVPFAQAKRFEKPVSAEAWTGVRNASRFGPGCAQGHPGSNPDVPVLQSEDCLHLNVYTPVITSQQPAAAVMVWFHGVRPRKLDP